LSSSPRSNTSSLAETLRRQVLPVLVWVLLALVLRWAVLEPRWIPSGSMLPALQLQDRVLVEKLRARLHRLVPIGTVVVFHPPAALLAAGYDPNSALIKRVVAKAGDEVEVRDGVLWRNGIKAAIDWSAEPMDYQLDPITVPPDHLLVLGDNRNASLDSHLWGPLPQRDLIGTAVLRYWPLDRIGWLRISAMGHPPVATNQLG
jgi:signal peptidase I